MTSPIADGVLAATHRLVQQAMSGQWQEVPKTIEERRLLLDKLTASASPQDQQWLGALRQAMAESDAVVASMTNAGGARGLGLGPEVQTSTASQSPTAEVDAVMDMIRGSKA
jgi:hypothetical protein